LKPFQESRERGWRRTVEEVNSSMIYLIHCKNLCKCYNVPPPSTTIKNNMWKCFCLMLYSLKFLISDSFI
jgi:hypothetical protein